MRVHQSGKQMFSQPWLGCVLAGRVGYVFLSRSKVLRAHGPQWSLGHLHQSVGGKERRESAPRETRSSFTPSLGGFLTDKRELLFFFRDEDFTVLNCITCSHSSGVWWQQPETWIEVGLTACMLIWISFEERRFFFNYYFAFCPYLCTVHRIVPKLISGTLNRVK